MAFAYNFTLNEIQYPYPQESQQKDGRKQNRQSPILILKVWAQTIFLNRCTTLDTLQYLQYLYTFFYPCFPQNGLFRLVPIFPATLNFQILAQIIFIATQELISCLRFIIHFIMEKNESEINIKMLNHIQKNPYFSQFQRFLKSPKRFGCEAKDFQLFYSYYLSRNIQNLINNKLGTNDSSIKPSFQAVLELILKNTQTSEILKILQSQEMKFRSRQSKDRKTSFFRTILKHLKKISRKGPKGSRGSNWETLDAIQEKLSKNTISKEDIAELIESRGAEIVEYLESQKVYADILNNNKSQRNKGFYILHLRQLGITARNGKLASYSFFLTHQLTQQIRNIAKTIFDEKWQKNGLETKKTPNITNIETCFQLKDVSDFDNLESLFIMLNHPPKYEYSNSIKLFNDSQFQEIVKSSNEQVSFQGLLQDNEVKTPLG